MVSLDAVRTPTFRAGLLIPSSNTTIEREYNAIGPWQVSWHFARLSMTRVDQNGIAEQDREMEAEAAKLGAAHPDVVLLCQSAISFIMGQDYVTVLKDRIATAADAPVLIAADTMVDLVAALGARRIALGTPFTDAVNATTQAYFESHRLEVVGISGFGIVNNFDIAALTREQLVDLALRVDRPEADAIVMPGGNMPCLMHLDAMEAAIGKPIVTTNLAGMWSIARLLGFTLDPDRFARAATV